MFKRRVESPKHAYLHLGAFSAKPPTPGTRVAGVWFNTVFKTMLTGIDAYAWTVILNTYTVVIPASVPQQLSQLHVFLATFLRSVWQPTVHCRDSLC